MDIATLVLNMVPMRYTHQGWDFKETYWVETVIPQQGVHLVLCLEKLGKPPGILQMMDQHPAQDSLNCWAHLCCVEHNLWMREWDLLPLTISQIAATRLQR